MRENDLRVYMLGTNFIFGLNLLVIVIFPVTYVGICVVKVRGSNSNPRSKLDADSPLFKDLFSFNISACKRFYLAWVLHYFPFYFMSRVLYFHHYFPAFIFSCCLTGTFLDLMSKQFAVYFCSFFRQKMPFLQWKLVNSSLLILLLSYVLQSFYKYSPLCYGLTGPLMSCSSANIYGLNALNC